LRPGRDNTPLGPHGYITETGYVVKREPYISLHIYHNCAITYHPLQEYVAGKKAPLDPDHHGEYGGSESRNDDNAANDAFCRGLHVGPTATYVRYEDRHIEYTRTETGTVNTKLRLPHPTDAHYCDVALWPSGHWLYSHGETLNKADCARYTQGGPYTLEIKPHAPRS
jgi:hypothetical protein